ncbi:MAG TPA: CapA family protein, partial [Thermoleophilaceae bacterium]|nr:CapA family protein [Thermoleophilaceae bacterium]
MRILRSRRAEQARVYRRRRLVAFAVLLASLLLLVRAVADDSNEPPPFIEGARSGSAAVDVSEAIDQDPAGSEPVELTVAATGDFLIHEPVFARALENGGGDRYDFRPMFREIRPYVGGADLAICHVETPMTDAAPTGYPVFNTPPALAGAIADTGWDMCSTASNHSLDRGLEGIRETNAVLDQAGIAHAGSYGSRREAAQPAIFEVEGVRVA